LVDFVFAVEKIVIGCTSNTDIVFTIQFKKLPSTVLAVKTHCHHAVPNLIIIIITFSLYHSFYLKTHTFSINAHTIKLHAILPTSNTNYFLRLLGHIKYKLIILNQNRHTNHVTP